MAKKKNREIQEGAEAPQEVPTEAIEMKKEVAPMNTQSIVIQKQVFEAPAPYSEGHTLNPNEAAALNQLFAENLRNNFSAKMRRAAEDDTTLTQEEFWAYAETYEFGIRSLRSGTVRDPVASEERRLAAAAVRKAIMKRGHKVKDVPEETFEAYVNSAVDTGKFRQQAEIIVAEKANAKVELDIDLSDADI